MVSNKTLRYTALVDGREGAYGVVFPDLPGCVAMGYTVEDALINAEDALRDYSPGCRPRWPRACRSPAPSSLSMSTKGSQLVSIPLIRVSGRKVRANLTLDDGVAAFIEQAKPDAAK